MYAVETLQKIVGINPLGRLGAYEADALRNFQYPQPLHPTAEPNRTEIDVTHQLLTLYQNYQVRLVTTTSTVSGVHYCYDTPKDNPTAARLRDRRNPVRAFHVLPVPQRLGQGRARRALQPLLLQQGHRGARLRERPGVPGVARLRRASR